MAKLKLKFWLRQLILNSLEKAKNEAFHFSMEGFFYAK